jgi:hypothetical protein
MSNPCECCDVVGVLDGFFDGQRKCSDGTTYHADPSWVSCLRFIGLDDCWS